MCFSPAASFLGGLLISGVGIATVKKIYKPSQIVFASIPLFFGIQQIAEGALWLSLQNPEYLYIQKYVTYIFLIMADVLWPMMIPFSVLFMEENRKRKKVLIVLLAIGIVLSMYYSYCLLFFNVNPQIMNYHIQYNSDFPKSLAMVAFIFYLIATITPLFVSSIKRVHLLGVLMFLSCLVTAIFFTQYLTSVWCFFAALISGVIYWILRDSKIQFNFEKLTLLKSKIKTITN
ncbi:MAG: hypothetical protein A2W99_15925 [Bacteroidetes bacterium GWF2_33_16]|nr:MAG: hypothetical protein A2X00_15270 [Bacteroidetes bacterium GWE2_32_14]OFY02392.1 MAG: hypothetical protein A2W99_15925 [Bacteroidetes bacterium GWF2_33_16]